MQDGLASPAKNCRTIPCGFPRRAGLKDLGSDPVIDLCVGTGRRDECYKLGSNLSAQFLEAEAG